MRLTPSRAGRIIICLLLCTAMTSRIIGQSRAEKQSEQLAALEKKWNNSISAADSTNLQITVGEYYDQHQRAIAGYTLQSLNALQELNLEPGASNRPEKLGESLSSWQKSQALLGKLQAIDKKVKALPDVKECVSGIGLVSDRVLILEHYEFLRLAGNNHEQLRGLPSVEDHMLREIGMLEDEMKKRGLYPSRPGPEISNLLEERYQLIKEFQAVAIKEAYSLGDASLEIAVHRRDLIDIVQNINSIQERLGAKAIKPAALLTEETLQKRKAILKHAFVEVTKLHHLQRHLNPQLKQHLDILEESIAIEQQELYNLQTIEGIRRRGPPLPPAADVYSPIPLPPSPGDGKFGLALHTVISEPDIVKATTNSAEKAEKLVQRNVEILQAAVPSLKTGPVTARRVSSNAKKPGIPSIRDELEFRANSVWDAVEAGDIQSAEYRTKNFADYGEVMAKDIPLSLNDFVSPQDRAGRLATLNALKRSLENAKAKGVYPFIRTDFDHEMGVVDVLIASLGTTNLDPGRIEKLTGLTTRPPPAESAEKQLLIRQLRNAEIMHAAYGANLHPSIGHAYKVRMETKGMQESTEILTAVQQYTEGNNPAIIKLLQNLPPETVKEMELNDYVKELAEQEQLLSEKVNRTLARAAAASTNFELPPGIVTALKKAQKSLPPPKYSPNVQDIKWRPVQSLKRVRETVISKEPGGIWLSPEKRFVLGDSSLVELWTIVSLEETCADPTEYGQWMVDDKSKICFSDNSLAVQKDHWLYQLKSWRE